MSRISQKPAARLNLKRKYNLEDVVQTQGLPARGLGFRASRGLRVYTLGPAVCKHFLHWAIWIPRVWNKKQLRATMAQLLIEAEVLPAAGGYRVSGTAFRNKCKGFRV